MSTDKASSRVDPVTFRRRLRNSPTAAEVALWKVLRTRQLGGLKFRRQHPIGPYVLDFFCTGQRLAIELDGDQHDEDHQKRHDDLREEYLKARLIRVMRFGNRDVLTAPASVYDAIARAADVEED
jgi:very-short-patch-repair endonuclease